MYLRKEHKFLQQNSGTRFNTPLDLCLRCNNDIKFYIKFITVNMTFWTFADDRETISFAESSKTIMTEEIVIVALRGCLMFLI